MCASDSEYLLAKMTDLNERLKVFVFMQDVCYLNMQELMKDCTDSQVQSGSDIRDGNKRE